MSAVSLPLIFYPDVVPSAIWFIPVTQNILNIFTLTIFW